jgi:integrase
MPLTDTECRNAKCPEGRALVRLADTGGLYLEVIQPGPKSPGGSKLWRWKYRHAGKEKRLALGRYPEVSLADARREHAKARELLANGTDPADARKEVKRTRLASLETSFKSVALSWWESWRVNKTDRYAEHVLRRLEMDAFPELGAKPVSELTAPAFVYLAKKIERRGAGELARRMLETCGQVMRWAVAHGMTDRNPVADVKPGDVLKPRTVENFARVGADELPELMRQISAYRGSVFTRLAMHLLALTFVRTSELICARWQEFDLDEAQWTIPADRKGRKGAEGQRRAHVVPLAPQALAVLRLLQTARGADRCTGAALLFPGERDHDKPMSDNTILKALERMGYKGRMTGHGFRGVASTALNEMGYRFDVIEAQLSHVETNRVRAAYNHAQYLDERRELMNAWADYLDAVQQTGRVIPFRQSAQARKSAA